MTSNLLSSNVLIHFFIFIVLLGVDKRICKLKFFTILLFIVKYFVKY